MRINGVFGGGIPKHQDRVESITTLKDGRKLEGYSFVIPTDKGNLPGFEPKKHQSDGTIWLSEDAVTGFDLLPSSIHIFRRDMVEYWGFDCPPARNSGMEPAMLKILLGIIYLDQGQKIVSHSAFDIIRLSLGGRLQGNIAFTWLDKPMVWGDSIIKNHEHAVYFEYGNQRLFRAGVALFGTGITFQIKGFSCLVPKRCVRWPGRPGP